METRFRVLLVDDEPDFTETMKKRLTRRGFDVDVAQDCSKALLKLENGAQDAVILDVMIPDMDGIQCLREIKTRWPSTPVIMLTGHASVNVGLKGMELGASDYCLKPIELDELVEKIQIAHEHHSETHD